MGGGAPPAVFETQRTGSATTCAGAEATPRQSRANIVSLLPRRWRLRLPFEDYLACVGCRVEGVTCWASLYGLPRVAAGCPSPRLA